MVCDNPAVVNGARGGEGQVRVSLELLSAEAARKPAYMISFFHLQHNHKDGRGAVPGVFCLIEMMFCK